ncbi:MAG: TonB-dependent receptor, partial [Burkholderiales bacterium]|nr:TonB-dependent receptor [Burkholderiales bacterium]
RGVTYAAVPNVAANLYSPNAYDNLGVPYLTGVNTKGSTTTAAAYLFDTLTLNEAWKLNGGLRVEHYRTTTDSGTIVTAANVATFPGYAVGGVAPSSLKDSDNLLSWNVGAVYKPAPNGSIYAGYANSLTPPGSANFTLSGAAGNQANATLEPQETTGLEFGTKWELLQKRLNIAGALFQTENDKQVTTDPVTLTAVQSGKTKVRGIELSAVGQLTRFWQISAGIQKTRTTQENQQNAAGVITDAVRWSPDLTATVWTSYQWGDFTLGGGARYVSEQKRLVTNANPATQNMPEIPSYAVVDLMAAYKVRKDITLRLNVYNLFDKEYISTLNNGGGRVTLGIPRSFVLTGTMTF